MFIELEYQPALEDFRNNGNMQIKAMLKLFETTGNKHAILIGDNLLSRTQSGNAWVFTDWKVQIKKYPKYEDKIVSRTWTETGSAIFTSTRNFELYANGELCVIATTRWAMINLEKGLPVKIGKDLMDLYQPEDKKTFSESKIEKIQMPETFEIEKPIYIRRADIDYNNHVHNINYLDYALDTMPQEIFDSQNFEHLRISYKLQLQYGETAVCKYANINGKHNFGIFGNNALKTQIELY